MSPSFAVAALLGIAAVSPKLPAQQAWLQARLLHPRDAATLTFDAARERLVLVGGEDDFGGNSALWDRDAAGIIPRAADPVLMRPRGSLPP